jgi:anti-sigma-K factor RskA
MKTDHPIDLLPALALGCLGDEERQTVRHHVSHCEDCRRELTAYQQVTRQLAFGAPSQSPPDRLQKRLMARIGRRAGTAGWFVQLSATWPRLIPAGILAGLLLIITLGTGNILLWQRMDRAALGTLEHTRTVWLMGAGQAGGAVGSLILVPDESQAILVVTAMVPLAPAYQYQLWLIKDGRRTSGGVFSVSEQGSAAVKVSADRPLDQFDAFGVTIEPFGGSPGPTGKKVLGGEMNL